MKTWKEIAIAHAGGEAEYLEKVAQAHGFELYKQLPDGTIIGVRNLMYTRAIFWDCEMMGQAKRFCYKDFDLADAQFHLIQNSDIEPTGWIATRPEPEGFYDPKPEDKP